MGGEMQSGALDARRSHEDADGRGGLRMTRRWATIAAVSAAASLWSVRVAAPDALDEKSTMLILFLVIPTVLILALAAASKRLGLALAVLFPFAWLAISMAHSDSVLLWFIPIAASATLLLTSRAAGPGRLRSAIMWASVLLAVGGIAWPGPGRSPGGTRLLLIGVDGATWNRIDPLIAEGRMPNLEKLLHGGHRARLRSLPSMFSPRVWSTIGTGCDPGVHGILAFDQRKSDFRVGTLWDRMKLDGRSFGLCGWYFTWPPEPGLAGTDFIIPSNIAPDARTFPPEYSFYRQLTELTGAGEKMGRRANLRSVASAGLRAWRNGLRLSTMRRAFVEVLARRLEHRGPLDVIWRNRVLSAALQADVFAHLVRTRRPELAAVLFTQVDHVSHRYWKYMEPEKFPEVTPDDQARYGQAIDRTYAEIDKGLGKILRSAPSETNVIIVSDHGFQAAYQKVAGQFCRIRTTRLIEALGCKDDLFGTNLDFDVFLRATSASASQAQDVLARVENTLGGAHLAGEEAPLLGLERQGESIRVWMLPRVLIKENERIEMGGKEYDFADLINARREAHYSGQHHPDGVYLLAGPAARTASDADSLNVLDVAPTAAAILDLPANPRWQGRPALKGPLFVGVGEADYPPPSQVHGAPKEMDKELKRKLRAIGYLD
jgi:hypothetical protein